MNLKHGKDGTSPNVAYWNMLSRCYNRGNVGFSRYGGRGITVCNQWRESFANFWADMGDTYRPGLTLDRRDNNGNYCKENCRWVTTIIQARNKSNNRRLTTRWGCITLPEASERSGIHPGTIRSRLRKGWSVRSMFALPTHMEKRNVS